MNASTKTNNQGLELSSNFISETNKLIVIQGVKVQGIGVITCLTRVRTVAANGQNDIAQRLFNTLITIL